MARKAGMPVCGSGRCAAAAVAAAVTKPSSHTEIHAWRADYGMTAARCRAKVAAPAALDAIAAGGAAAESAPDAAT